jgi:hypothetical protein
MSQQRRAASKQPFRLRAGVLQGRWLPELQEMVKTIDAHFSRYLRAMGCNGQARSISFSMSGSVQRCQELDCSFLGVVLRVAYKTPC